ncbi:pheromone A receptor-domain-containing protein [Pisolithus marmoratus]|nr:pheromone A receptor-domain-containing protein [Pisolithus marmoratus]
MGYPPNWFFSACAFIGFVLCAIPLPWHLKARNTGTCLYMIWAGLACLMLFINSVVWNSTVINKAPIWCDISSKFIIGSAVALPAASLCINRHLYHIVSVDSVTRTRAEKRRDVLVDLAIGLGIPILEMILHYIVQAQRFLIFEEIGCYPSIYNTLPAYALVSCWPVAIGIVSAGYCLGTIRKLALRRAQIKGLLYANGNMSPSQYFRLMGLAGVEVLGTVPIGAYIIYRNATDSNIQPWISWANVHYDFSYVPQYPSSVWQENPQLAGSLHMTRYLFVVCATIFFAFFGFSDEARRNYWHAYASIVKVRISTGTMSNGPSGTEWKQDMSYDRHPGMPIFIIQRTGTKRDSLASFSTNHSIDDLGDKNLENKQQPYLATTSEHSNDITLPSLPEPTLEVNTVPRHRRSLS